MRIFLLSLVLCSAALANEATFAEGCLLYWKSSMTDTAQFQQAQPRIKKLCQCQAKEVFSANLPVAAVDDYEKFMRGGAVRTAQLEQVGVVFNGAEGKCEKSAMQ